MALNKIKYYLKLIFKKPYLALSYLYTNHLGVILLIPLSEKTEPLKMNEDSKLKVGMTNDPKVIFEFYKRMNRDAVNKEAIRNWLSKSFDCFLVYSSNGLTIGAMWVFKNEFNLNRLSGRILSKNKMIILDKYSLYG